MQDKYILTSNNGVDFANVLLPKIAAILILIIIHRISLILNLNKLTSVNHGSRAAAALRLLAFARLALTLLQMTTIPQTIARINP